MFAHLSFHLDALWVSIVAGRLMRFFFNVFQTDSTLNFIAIKHIPNCSSVRYYILHWNVLQRYLLEALLIRSLHFKNSNAAYF